MYDKVSNWLVKNDVDIDKLVVFHKVSWAKKVLNNLLVAKMLIILVQCIQCFQKLFKNLYKILQR